MNLFSEESSPTIPLEYFHEGFDENHGIKREAIVREYKWYESGVGEIHILLMGRSLTVGGQATGAPHHTSPKSLSFHLWDVGIVKTGREYDGGENDMREVGRKRREAMDGDV
jgi:hypothetical protein